MFHHGIDWMRLLKTRILWTWMEHSPFSGYATWSRHRCSSWWPWSAWHSWVWSLVSKALYCNGCWCLWKHLNVSGTNGFLVAQPSLCLVFFSSLLLLLLLNDLLLSHFNQSALNCLRPQLPLTVKRLCLWQLLGNPKYKFWLFSEGAIFRLKRVSKAELTSRTTISSGSPVICLHASLTRQEVLWKQGPCPTTLCIPKFFKQIDWVIKLISYQLN